MIDRQESIKKLTKTLTEKQEKKLKSKVLANLNKKLLDIKDDEVEAQFLTTYNLLQEISNGSINKKKEYNKAFTTLKKTVRDKYDLVETGALVGEYMAMGVAIGLAFGAALTFFNTTLLAIGLPIGLAIGLSIGQNKENQVKENGNLY